MRPFVKWAGGKRQILSLIKDFIEASLDGTNDDYTYIEPFIGGGAVLFNFTPNRAIINDLNEDLINAYKVIKSEKYYKLIKLLRKFEIHYNNDKDGFYYAIRAMDRRVNWPANAPEIFRAARMIFLNKTCYNGLYRVNNRGEFNTPIGRYKNPTICDEENIIEVHNYLNSHEIEIMNGSYEFAISRAKDGDVIYVDPPYDYEDDDGFTKYQMQGFTFNDFEKLKIICDKAISRGAFVILSNNATDRVLRLFEQDPKYKILYSQNTFSTLRSINSKGNGRKTGLETIIWGIPGGIPFPQANSMEKIIKYLTLDEDCLKDKSKALDLIGVSSERQVSYYQSALMYFGYITHSKKFTETANKIRNDKILIEKDIYRKLLSDKVVYSVYSSYAEQKKLDIIDISKVLKKYQKGLSDSTTKRRASTVKAWVEWMEKYENNL